MYGCLSKLSASGAGPVLGAPQVASLRARVDDARVADLRRERVANLRAAYEQRGRNKKPNRTGRTAQNRTV